MRNDIKELCAIALGPKAQKVLAFFDYVQQMSKNELETLHNSMEDSFSDWHPKEREIMARVPGYFVGHHLQNAVQAIWAMDLPLRTTNIQTAIIAATAEILVGWCPEKYWQTKFKYKAVQQ